MKKVFFFSWIFLVLIACGDSEVTNPTPDVSDIDPIKQELVASNDTSVKKDSSVTGEIDSVKVEQVAKTVEKTPAKSVTSQPPEAKKVAIVEQEKPKKKKKRPVISFKEKKWNFGEIRAGDIVEHNFKFKNTGEADLTIRNVTASCGCTQPSFPFLPIAPGEEGVIGVTFNSTGKINEQRPTVTVSTNGRPATQKLYLEGKVLQKLEN